MSDLKDRVNLDDGKWGTLNFGVSVAGAVLIFIGACTIAADACMGGGCNSTLQAGAAFAFFAAFAWIGSCLFAWRDMAGKFCWQ